MRFFPINKDEIRPVRDLTNNCECLFCFQIQLNMYK